ncbi:MAG: response regulator [Candidatus Scalinduaceae bacterium]
MPKKKILVVDDDASLTCMLRENLEATGKYEVREENVGALAYASAQQFQPDLIILDVVMPDVDGGAVGAKILDDENLKYIPIVFLTAILKKEEAESTGSNIAGCTFLAKPVKLDDLITCIENRLCK